MIPSRITRPLMALGLAAATITGGLLVQPRSTDQDLAAIPAPLSTERITPRTTPPSSSRPVDAGAAITAAPSTTSGESSPTATSPTAETLTSTQPTSESPTPERTPVSRSSDERSPRDVPSSGGSSPSESASPQQSSGGHPATTVPTPRSTAGTSIISRVLTRRRLNPLGGGTMAGANHRSGMGRWG